jgi:hypothetical protein
LGLKIKNVEKIQAKRPAALARLQWSDGAPHHAQRTGNSRRSCVVRLRAYAAPSIAKPHAQWNGWSVKVLSIKVSYSFYPFATITLSLSSSAQIVISY